MVRTLYRWLVKLHPRGFRREFADEMVSIYDETVWNGGILPLFSDVLRSLGRQWLIRSGGWRVAAVLAAAVLQVSIGGIVWFCFGLRPVQSDWSAEPHPEIAAIMRLAALTALGLLSGVILLVLWWRRLARRIGGGSARTT